MAAKVNTLTVDDVITTTTNNVWRDKLSRETRAQKEWHHRFADQFGLPPRPPSSDPAWRQLRPTPDLPPPGRVPQVVEPTASALRWDAAVGRGNVPLRAPSVVSSSKRSGVSLPSMKTVSISSSADRRRELLLERHQELQAQLQLVESMLSQAKPSTQISMASGVSAYSAYSAASRASAASAARSAASSARSAAPVMPTVPELDTYAAPPPQQPYEPVPLMLDPSAADYTALSPFRSGAGVGFALPGATLSAASHSPRY